MLAADGPAAAAEAAVQYRQIPVPQLWDGSKKLGSEVARSIGAPEWTAWDIYLFYAPGAEWTDQGLPAPEAALAQAGGVVVGTKGTLPPAGDPSFLPKPLAGRVDVVGEQKNLEALLLRVAESFAARHERR